MMFPELKNHQVWRDLTEILHNLDANTLVRQHLQFCDYKVCGYWDEQDEYYEEIILPQNLEAELISSSIGVTNSQRWVQLKFLLKASHKNGENHSNEAQKVSELILIYDENLEFLDENWILDIDSPLLEIKRTHTNSL
ncbi:MAG: hypothetical protein ACHBN1_15070 [Heteroscytonema crispum UTEX LB 1556]